MNKAFNLPALILVAISLILLGCAKNDDSSSSSSSDDVSAASGSGAISLSAKVSMVSAKDSASTARTANRTANAIDTSGFASTADYNVDRTQTFVYEESADVLDTVNSILCQIGQTRPGLMMNEGNYSAQVDVGKCQETGSDAPSYETWYVNSSRASGQPMYIKAWVPNDQDDDGTNDGYINAKMNVKRPPSSEYPVGFFNMNFKMVGNDGTESMKGFMKTKKTSGGNQLQFYMPINMGGTIYDYAVKANFNSDGSGTGGTSMPNWIAQGQAQGAKTFQVAFNDDYFYKQKSLNGVAQTAVCLDRNKYLTSAWRYGMYDSNGARVPINSGFPITATASGTTYHGYIGYYGLWMPPNANIDNGSTVTKMDYSNPDAAGDNYTVRSWGGKLVKYTKKSITLESIKNVPLTWQNQADQGGRDFRVYWDSDNDLLKIDAYRSQSTSYQWVDQTVTTLTLDNQSAEHGFYFYSEALGGDGQIVLAYPGGDGTNPTAPADNSTVVFNTRDPVFPGDSVPATLACYENCPNPDTIATGSDAWYATGSSSVYHANKRGSWLGRNPDKNWAWDLNSNITNSNYHRRLDNASAPTPYIYTFDNTTNGMVLQYDNGTKYDVILSSANNNLSYGSSIRSGPLFDNDSLSTATISGDNKTSARQTALAALKCSEDSTKICTRNVRSGLSTYYVWETGPQSHHKLEVLVDSGGSSQKFDPPLMVKYEHSGTTSNTGKSYDGVNFYLRYGGFGDLWGIPTFCVNMITGVKSDCDSNSRWVQEVVVPAGSLAVQVADSTTEYVIKPLEVEQTMVQASSTSVCTNAGLSLGSVTVPDNSNWEDPDIGDRPTITGPPKILSGEPTN